MNNDAELVKQFRVLIGFVLPAGFLPNKEGVNATIDLINRDAIGATFRELDRLTAERDAARKDLADLRARLTKIADENETICREHTSVGNDQDDAWVSAWGAAGKELREALGLESEAAERDTARAEMALAWAYLLRYARNTATPDEDVMRAEGILVGMGLPLVELPEDGTP